jgi:hypothetical protein
MLEAPIRSRRRAFCLTIATLTIFSSCATEKPRTALINDPDSQAESSIPWNAPKKWETGANLPGGIGGGGGPVGSSVGN